MRGTTATDYFYLHNYVIDYLYISWPTFCQNGLPANLVRNTMNSQGPFGGGRRRKIIILRTKVEQMVYALPFICSTCSDWLVNECYQKTCYQSLFNRWSSNGPTIPRTHTIIIRTSAICCCCCCIQRMLLLENFQVENGFLLRKFSSFLVKYSNFNFQIHFFTLSINSPTYFPPLYA